MRFFIHPLTRFNESIPEKAKVLDVGALNFTEYERIKHSHPLVEHFGIDYTTPTHAIPLNYIFKSCDLNKSPIPFDDDFFDVIIASHVIEHLNDPLVFFQECMRVLKPGGKFYLEAPSERSVNLKGNLVQMDKMFSISLYDDPTHTKRPWTAQSYYRLAKYFDCNPLEINYIQSWIIKLAYPILKPYSILTKNGRLLEKITWLAKGWAVYMIATKEKKGKPEFRYFVHR